MKPENENAPGLAGPRGANTFEIALTTPAHSTTVGRYPWRRDRGLLTLSDHVRRYLAVRHPRGPWVPLPGDLIGREVAPHGTA